MSPVVFLPYNTKENKVLSASSVVKNGLNNETEEPMLYSRNLSVVLCGRAFISRSKLESH